MIPWNLTKINYPRIILPVFFLFIPKEVSRFSYSFSFRKIRARKNPKFLVFIFSFFFSVSLRFSARFLRFFVVVVVVVRFVFYSNSRPVSFLPVALITQQQHPNYSSYAVCRLSYAFVLCYVHRWTFDNKKKTHTKGNKTKQTTWIIKKMCSIVVTKLEFVTIMVMGHRTRLCKVRVIRRSLL